LLVKKRKRYVKTTYSRHGFRKYRNLIKDKEITRRDEVYVSDITYIDTVEGYCYLSLVTDVATRKIKGYHLSKELTMDGTLAALKEAVKGVNTEGMIHHSDRGIQYCSNEYVGYLEGKGIRISMTEENHAYENAIAERVNGILKDEFYLGEKLRSYENALMQVEDAVKIYNDERLHQSLGYTTPTRKYEEQYIQV
jgi:putative transposase